MAGEAADDLAPHLAAPLASETHEIKQTPRSLKTSRSSLPLPRPGPR
jgi:hypothetical protein